MKLFVTVGLETLYSVHPPKNCLWGEFDGNNRFRNPLKVPKREIFDRSNFPDFYAIKSSWVGDLVVKIITYYFNF